MPGTYDTSALCLAALKRYARIPEPASGAWPQDADLYALLTDAENAVKLDLAPRIPNALVQVAALSTSDGGRTYTFGTDAEGNRVYPLAQVEVFGRVEDIPHYPLRPYEDYVAEGNQIRMVAAAPRTFPSGGPVARFIPMTLTISATTAPTLLPIQMRELVVVEAARRYARAALQPELLGMADADYGLALQRWVTAFQTQYSGAGMVGVRSAPYRRGGAGRWFRRGG